MSGLLLSPLFRNALGAILAGFGAGGAGLPPQEARTDEVVASTAGLLEAAAHASPAPFRYEPGAGVPFLLIPRAERLEYKAYMDLGPIGSHVGRVVQTCTVEEQLPSILLTKPSGPLGEAASIRLYASGSYLTYEFESTLETRVLPQEWPRVRYASVSKSSRTRRREVLLGTREGAPLSSYRADTTKGAPKGTPIWRPARERSVPEGTLDMLSAIFQARALIREGTPDLVFPLIDSDKLWQLRLRRGEEQRIETSEGTSFDVVEVVLEPSPYPGETQEEKARFKGVFGIHGSMHLWVETHTGIAVRIQGELPLGGDSSPIRVGIDVVLDSYSGTPPEFAPVKVAKKE